MTPQPRDPVEAPYVDTCVLLSLFLNDAGFPAAEQWLLDQGDSPLWVSHWALVEFAGVVSLCRRRGDLTNDRAAAIHKELESFRRERLQLLEPRGTDFLQARQWLQELASLPLRSGDALHLAIAGREKLRLATADQTLIRAAPALGLVHQAIGNTLM
ncbi:PilT protein domain-containing protein [Cyanobium sp. Copco_Reservoir_LC18]|jgi:predicted nucleic acid-binding protein|uniref:type II toxin-antitoxin system VapC family toxin n=1 Tax=Cyanobium sp. Copco_Reservoir_LC18 TaxID=1328305 RepID=UPI00135A5521|nr:type II toxin-antitoxin system VapC family toxin [Cyanobium sp. Copco_Reservoir_LC18]KAF0652415.1 PilT protein domain-containing protein [Cyanobium sp. Copco_Reservoir_LC18]